MNRINIFKTSYKFSGHWKLCALAIIALLLTVSAPAQAQHDMHNMPGMSSGKARNRTKAKSKTSARRRLRARKSGRIGTLRRGPARSSPRPAASTPKAPSQKTNTHMPGMHVPETDSTAKPTATPHQMNVPGVHAPSPSTAPNSPSTEKMDLPGVHGPAHTSPSQPSTPPDHSNMPGMQMPGISTPPKVDQTHPQSSHDNMPGMGNVTTPAKSGDSSETHAMPGMEMGATDNMPTGPDSVALMSGDQMAICIGPGTANTLPMGQMGSGSSWQPSTTPMYMYGRMVGSWTVFIHADAKIGVNSQGGPRGVTKFESQNWIMPMAYHRAGPGTLQLRGMFSFEPFTLAPGGSPELFQTGETYRGKPIIDKQHPHDLFMELSGTYTVALGEKGTWFTYLGFPGEPALGPTAFMHRASASENPAAPLSHHLQDSTHISFGVFSTGFTYRGLKLEASVFNGREPDENRYDFEFNPWNSRSARISYAPNENWSMQVSYGFLKNPEALEPGDIRRASASISYNKRFREGNWASSLIWGRNHLSHGGEVANLNGYTAESTLNFLKKNYLYTRLELADKNELLRAEDRTLLGIAAHHPSFRIGAYTFGYVRDIWETKHLSVALGADTTFYSKPPVLDQLYGNNPMSYHFFVRIRPRHMSMAGK